MTDLIDFLLELMRDPTAAAAFDANPDGALAARGLEGVSAQDVRDARLELCDDGGASATGDPAAHYGHDPIREINHTTQNYSASSHYAPHAAAHEHAALAVQAAAPITIDDRDTFFIQNNVSDDDVTIVNDSFNQDNDTSVVAIKADNSFNETTDVTAIDADNSFNDTTDVGDVTQVVDGAGTGGPDVLDTADPGAPDVTDASGPDAGGAGPGLDPNGPAVSGLSALPDDGLDPNGPAVSGLSTLPDDPEPDAGSDVDLGAVDEPVDERVDEADPEPVHEADPGQDDPGQDEPADLSADAFDPVA